MIPGQYVIPASDYLSDPAAAPSLSSSIARILLSESPAHARHAHPRLNPAYVSEEKEAFDCGTAAHQLILEGSSAGFDVISADDWRTKAAKELRDVSRSLGRTPLLERQFRAAATMRDLVVQQLADFEPPVPFTAGAAEQTLVWNDDGVWCRARLDWLTNDRRMIWDLKSTATSANPETFSRQIFNMGMDVQAGFYLRGVKALFGIDAEFEFIVIENEPPYAVSRIALAPDALDLAHRKVSRAINLWRECMTSGEWPGYPRRTCYVEAPPWELAKWEDAGEFSEKGIMLESQP